MADSFELELTAASKFLRTCRISAEEISSGTHSVKAASGSSLHAAGVGNPEFRIGSAGRPRKILAYVNRIENDVVLHYANFESVVVRDGHYQIEAHDKAVALGFRADLSCDEISGLRARQQGVLTRNGRRSSNFIFEQLVRPTSVVLPLSCPALRISNLFVIRPDPFVRPEALI
jgi:hypothetical protein